jgi:hypothetical protein
LRQIQEAMKRKNINYGKYISNEAMKCLMLAKNGSDKAFNASALYCSIAPGAQLC